MDEKLTKKANIFLYWAIRQATESAAAFVDARQINKEKFKSAEDAQESLAKVLLLLHVYLIDVCADEFQLGDKKGDFMDYVMRKAAGIAEGEPIEFSRGVNSFQKFNVGRKLFADDKNGEDPDGTLFWVISRSVLETIYKPPVNNSSVVRLYEIMMVALFKLFEINAEIDTLDVSENDLTSEERQYLENWINKMKIIEMAQAEELIRGCNVSYQFARTHSVYLKDWEKTKGQMEMKLKNGILPPGVSARLFRSIIDESDELIQKKLSIVRNAFQYKFGESIYNYLGPDGKTKKFLGLF